MTKKYVMLIKNDAAANNNKFYEVKLEDDDQVGVRYGRVGDKSGVMNNEMILPNLDQIHLDYLCKFE